MQTNELRSSGPPDSADTSCRVEQLTGRDYTDPAFNIEVAVEDDKSDVEMTLCIGTYAGGCDVMKNEPLGGQSTIIYKV